MSISHLLFRALVGLVATTTVTHTAARSTPAQAAQSDDASSNNESAIFARFSDLDSEATEARLKDLSASEDTYGAMLTINKLLASGGSAKDVEETVLALVEKATTDETDDTLAALLLDYYETYLRDDLLAGDLTPADVFDELGERNDTLTTATYGSSWRTSKSVRKRHVRR
ncbi:MAG: hypothetical protein ACI8S6_005405 [Myxococcota bacterium]|jgi:hypothetical protein